MTECRRSDAVEAENSPGVAVVNREEGLGAALFVALPCVALKKVVQFGVAAIEGFPVMRSGDWLLMPCGKPHASFGIAAMAARSLAFGAGGFSRRSRTSL